MKVDILERGGQRLSADATKEFVLVVRLRTLILGQTDYVRILVHLLGNVREDVNDRGEK